jgi:hypothetical protein
MTTQRSIRRRPQPRQEQPVDVDALAVKHGMARSTVIDTLRSGVYKGVVTARIGNDGRLKYFWRDDDVR